MSHESRCVVPQMAEPGSSSWARACGDCIGCRADERAAAAKADGLVAIEIQPARAPRLLELVRTPLWHRAGDTPLVEAVELAVGAFDAQLLEATPA